MQCCSRSSASVPCHPRLGASPARFDGCRALLPVSRKRPPRLVRSLSPSLCMWPASLPLSILHAQLMLPVFVFVRSGVGVDGERCCFSTRCCPRSSFLCFPSVCVCVYSVMKHEYATRLHADTLARSPRCGAGALLTVESPALLFAFYVDALCLCAHSCAHRSSRLLHQHHFVFLSRVVEPEPLIPSRRTAALRARACDRAYPHTHTRVTRVFSAHRRIRRR